MLSFRIFEGGKAEWDKFNDANNPFPFFHSWDWLALLEKHSEAQLKKYCACEGSELAAVFPVFEFKKIGRFGFSPPPGLMTPYGGPVGSSRAANFLVEQMKKRIAFLRFSCVPRNEFDFGRKKIFSTFILSLGGGEQLLWQNLDKKTRNLVRFAQKQDQRVVEGGEKELEVYLEMLAETYKSAGLGKPSNEFIRSAFKSFSGDGRMKLFVAEKDGELGAGALFLYGNRKMYYFSGASFRRLRYLKQNNLVQWHAIVEASRNGLEEYDLMGANTPGVREFKEGWGGKEERYFLFEFGTAPVKAAIKGITLVRNLVR